MNTNKDIEKMVEQLPYTIHTPVGGYSNIKWYSASTVIETLTTLITAVERTTIEKCKQIFIDEVDWSEWGISAEEAGTDFEKYLQALTNTK